MGKKIKQSYNNNDLIIENNLKEKNITHYVIWTKRLQKANIIMSLFVCSLFCIGSYTLILKQEDAKLYLTSSDGRIFEYKNDRDSARQIRNLKIEVSNEK